MQATSFFECSLKKVEEPKFEGLSLEDANVFKFDVRFGGMELQAVHPRREGTIVHCRTTECWPSSTMASATGCASPRIDCSRARRHSTSCGKTEWRPIRASTSSGRGLRDRTTAEARDAAFAADDAETVRIESEEMEVRARWTVL